MTDQKTIEILTDIRMGYVPEDQRYQALTEAIEAIKKNERLVEFLRRWEDDLK